MGRWQLRDQRLWLSDILRSASRVQLWASAITESEFYQQGIAYSAILREFIVVGEAVKRLDADRTATQPEVPWRELARFRDVVVHTYFGLQDDVVWHAATAVIPDLIAAARTMLDAALKEQDSSTPPPATGRA